MKKENVIKPRVVEKKLYIGRLGVSFHLDLEVKMVDVFMVEKIHKKLRFWNMVHLCIVEKAMVFNVMLE
jgi:hypothetical protein